jgi:hypothetical protein
MISTWCWLIKGLASSSGDEVEMAQLHQQLVNKKTSNLPALPW